MSFEQFLIGSFVAINILAFAFMAYDKRKAMSGGGNERVPEGLIFCIAILFGSIGVYAAMFAFRHKIRKWYFQLGIPTLIAQNLATLYVLRELFAAH